MEEPRVLQCDALHPLSLDVALAVAAIEDNAFWRRQKREPTPRGRPAQVVLADFVPAVLVRVEYPQVLEIRRAYTGVDKAAKQHQIVLPHGHAVATACAWAHLGLDTFPRALRERIHPQVAVVVEVCLLQRCEFAPKQPQLTTTSGRADHLVRRARPRLRVIRIGAPLIFFRYVAVEVLEEHTAVAVKVLATE